MVVLVAVVDKDVLDMVDGGVKSGRRGRRWRIEDGEQKSRRKRPL